MPFMLLFLLFSTRHMFIIITGFFICVVLVTVCLCQQVVFVSHYVFVSPGCVCVTRLCFRHTMFVSPGCENPMSESLLTEREHLRMNVVCLLCRWCSHETETTSGPGRGGALSPTGVKKRLLNMLDEETGWDPIHPFDLQMVRDFNVIVKLN